MGDGADLVRAAAGGGEEVVEGVVHLVQEEERLHDVLVWRAVDRGGAEEHGDVAAGVDDGLARASALGDAAGHHAVEDLLQV